MKTKIIIFGWVCSLMLMATDSILQALIALSLFAISTHMMNKNKVEVKKEIDHFEKKLKITNK